jgi:hypothetical protein
VPQKEGFADYLYCRISSEAKNSLPQFDRDTMVHVAGVLIRKNQLQLMGIANVNSAQDWKAPKSTLPASE